jgi:hypothetical protein
VWRRSREPASRRPSLDDAVRLTKDTATALSRVTGEPYGERARSELEVGEQQSEEGLGNPAAYAHLVIDSYAQATGDLLHGAAEISRGRHNLAFSSAAVARSAGEYAGIGWWLADPVISADTRIVRTAGILVGSVTAARGLLAPEDFAHYENDNKQRLEWAKRRQRKKERLPDKTDRFIEMNPEEGKRHYNYFSLLAHGDLGMTVGIVRAKLSGSGELGDEPVWRLLFASGYGLTLAARISELRERPSDHPALYARLMDYASRLEDQDDEPVQ